MTKPEPREILASLFMFPSLYMGGPSRANYRNADEFLRMLAETGYKIVEANGA